MALDNGDFLVIPQKINIDKELCVKLQVNGIHVPLPKSFIEDHKVNS